MLTVSTITDGLQPQWLLECEASVAAALPAGASHVVHLMGAGGDFQLERWAATTAPGSGYVAWVDHDDLIHPDALHACVTALEQTGAGIAFTDENIIDAAGQVIGHVGPRSHRVTRRDIAMHPRSLHHLAVIRLECLSEDVLEIALEVGIGIDWLMRAFVALRYGAVRVPMVGYLWRNHPQQESAQARWTAAYRDSMQRLRAILLPMVHSNAYCPELLPR